ncbi:DUF5110 domain-containing protein [Paenibacillus prosopidis]|uniref:Uncharacterized protein DUF5110 n=1 Tax=Paenibacillus prosopidis TaxID=630520 RepID=A0A368VLX8_9BACL|nr:uncharacterized protein DUF5110 [Paenibacillus prosopidis]
MLYEDDCTTFEQRNGVYNWVKIEWKDGVEFTRNGNYPGIRYNISG